MFECGSLLRRSGATLRVTAKIVERHFNGGGGKISKKVEVVEVVSWFAHREPKKYVIVSGKTKWDCFA